MRLSFDFPADTAVLAKIGELTAETSRCAGFNDREINDIQLAVDEACTNTIIHGLNQDPANRFQLIFQWRKGEIEILICESGHPFDITRIKPPNVNVSLENRAIGGLGIYFIRKLMDKLEYSVDEKGRKTFRMVKRRRLKFANGCLKNDT